MTTVTVPSASESPPPYTNWPPPGVPWSETAERLVAAFEARNSDLAAADGYPVIRLISGSFESGIIAAIQHPEWARELLARIQSEHGIPFPTTNWPALVPLETGGE